jgi:hypothetical protein
MLALISALPLGIQYCIWFTICPGRGSSNGFYLAFPIIIALILQIREAMCEFWQVLSISKLCILRWKITTKWVQGPTGATLSWTLTKTSLITWPHESPLWLEGYNTVFDLPELTPVQCQSPVCLERSDKSPFPQSTVTLVKVCRYLCGRMGERLPVKLFDRIQGSFLKRTWPPLHSSGFRSINWLKSDNYLRDYDFLVMI